MSIYHTCYSPDGDMFEVPFYKFEELVLSGGWTQTKPVPAPEPESVKTEPVARRTSRATQKDEKPVAKKVTDEVPAE